MRTAIIVHGIVDNREEYEKEHKMGYVPESHAHWFPWLAGQLTVNRDILTQCVEMPHPYKTDMKYDEWAQTFENFKINNDTILIGHSAGCGFLLKYLATHPEMRAGQLILVAPFVDPDNTTNNFMKDWDSDPGLPKRIGAAPGGLDKTAGGVEILYSTDDMSTITESVRQVREKYGFEPNVRFHEFTDKDHFCFSDIGPEFPELLEIIK
ncbi:MAG: alpha/beta hydrolase [Alphaproteobacteria bacterium]|nr:alpha/beta hydrolase [Alphaproteobacteria bacterium]